MQDDTAELTREKNSQGNILRQMALQACIALESPSTRTPICGVPDCNAAGIIQCLDCDHDDLLCRSCAVSAHSFLPFHKIRKWNGSFFEPTSLNICGLILHMNHGQGSCPHVKEAPAPQDLTVVDTNGVHIVSIGWCCCFGAPSFAEQLFSRRIFPASTLRPKTAFTFRVLKLFHMFNHVARTTPWDFTGAMNRLTDNVDVKSTPVSAPLPFCRLSVNGRFCLGYI